MKKTNYGTATLLMTTPLFHSMISVITCTLIVQVQYETHASTPRYHLSVPPTVAYTQSLLNSCRSSCHWRWTGADCKQACS